MEKTYTDNTCLSGWELVTVFVAVLVASFFTTYGLLSFIFG